LATINKPFYDITSPGRPHIATFFAGFPRLRNFFHAPKDVRGTQVRQLPCASLSNSARFPDFSGKQRFLRGVMTLWQAGGQPARTALPDMFAAHKTGSFA
jgi:hypothetical protein